MFVSKRAHLLERAVEGLACTDQEVRDLVLTARRIRALTSPACAPREEFVRSLGARLRAEALSLSGTQARSTSPSREAARPAALGGAPRVLVIGRRLPGVLAGATASVLVLGAVLGGASRSAPPGALLYPMRQMLDSAAVQLAGSDFNHGVTLLSQGQEHLADARALVEHDRRQAVPAPVDQALLNAYDAVSAGRRALLGDFDRTGSAASLLAVQDFIVRALPQLEALRALVSPTSAPGVDALVALLETTRSTVAGKIAVCGQPCASLGAPSLPVREAPGGPTVTTPASAIARPVGPHVDITASPRQIHPSRSAVIQPPVTVGSIPATSSPVVILPPLPLPTPRIAMTSIPTLLPGLP